MVAQHVMRVSSLLAVLRSARIARVIRARHVDPLRRMQQQTARRAAPVSSRWAAPVSAWSAPRDNLLRLVHLRAQNAPPDSTRQQVAHALIASAKLEHRVQKPPRTLRLIARPAPVETGPTARPANATLRTDVTHSTEFAKKTPRAARRRVHATCLVRASKDSTRATQ